jgi:outer membrane immunogenic protein
MLHRFMLSAAAIMAIGAAAPAVAQEESPWSGFYAGINLGGNWGDSSSHFTATNGNGAVVIPPADVSAINGYSTSGKSNDAGFTGGGELGYNFRLGNVLLGVETDIDAMNVNQVRSATFQSAALISPPIKFTIAQRLSTDWMWTLRPRIGYIANRWLFFGTFGLAVSDVKLETAYSDTAISPRAFSAVSHPTKTGFAGGVGVAYAFSPHWSIKGEWLYTDLGKVSTTAIASNGYGTLTSFGDTRSNIVRMGVDYRF